MKKYLAILIVLLMAAMAYGQITVVTPPLGDGVYVLRISNGQASLSVGVQPNVGPIVTPVIPVVPVNPVVPVTDLNSATAAAIAAVPDYANKGAHLKQFAFALNMVVGSINNSPKPVAEGITLIRGLADSVFGADKDKWAPFWAAIDPYLTASASNAQLSANYGVIQQAFANALPDSGPEGEEFGDFPTYGLQMDGANGEWLRFLMEMLPIILEIIKMFAVL